MRNELVAGVGGVVIGHIGWLVAISVAIASISVSSWVLVVAASSGLLALLAGLLGWRQYQRTSMVWAAFLWGLPISPVLMSLAVLGVTYL